MRAIVLPAAVIAAAMTAAYVVLYLAIPTVGPERAIRAARAVFIVGAAGLVLGFGWTVWMVLRR